MDAETGLRELVAERVAAVANKDAATLAARQHPDVITYNVLPPLHARGSEAVEAATAAWFASYDGPIGYDVSDLNVTAEGDVGFCSFLYHVTGTLKSGDVVDMWVRATLGCVRTGGRWLITHDHESVPFDPATGQALVSLTP